MSDPELVVNVGTDDFDGAYQLGKYWADHGFRKTLFLTENTAEMDQLSICRISKSDDRGIWRVQKGRKINLTFGEKRSTQITI